MLLVHVCILTLVLFYLYWYVFSIIFNIYSILKISI